MKSADAELDPVDPKAKHSLCEWARYLRSMKTPLDLSHRERALRHRRESPGASLGLRRRSLDYQAKLVSNAIEVPIVGGEGEWVGP